MEKGHRDHWDFRFWERSEWWEWVRQDTSSQNRSGEQGRLNLAQPAPTIAGLLQSPQTTQLRQFFLK